MNWNIYHIMCQRNQDIYYYSEILYQLSPRSPRVAHSACYNFVPDVICGTNIAGRIQMVTVHVFQGFTSSQLTFMSTTQRRSISNTQAAYLSPSAKSTLKSSGDFVTAPLDGEYLPWPMKSEHSMVFNHRSLTCLSVSLQVCIGTCSSLWLPCHCHSISRSYFSIFFITQKRIHINDICYTLSITSIGIFVNRLKHNDYC